MSSLYSLGTPVQVVAATANNSFPGLAVCSDGSLLAVWRSAPSHTNDASSVMQASRSTDGGATWSTPTEILSDPTYDVRGGTLTKLANGDLLLKMFLAGGSANVGIYYSRSTDDGATWGALTLIPFTITGTIAEASPIIELTDGTLVAAAYGGATSNWSAKSLRSTDGGATWSGEATIANGVTDSRVYAEPYLEILPTGDLMALVRCDTTSTIYRSVSADGGVTWGALTAAIGGAGGRPAWITRGTDVFAFVRDYSGSNANQYTKSADNGATWSPRQQFGASPIDTATYAQPALVTGGIGVAFSVQDSDSAADVSYVKLTEIDLGVTFADAELALSPTLFLKGAETSGTVAVDSSGNGRNGTYTGGPTFSQPSLLPSGEAVCVAFDGINDRASVPHNVAFNLTTAGWTLVAFVKLDNPASNAAQILFDKSGTSTSGNNWSVFYENRTTQSSPRRLRFVAGGGNVDWAGDTTRDALAAGGMLVCRYGSGKADIFWNGAQVATGTVTNSNSSVTRQLDIGSLGGSSLFMDGEWQDFALYGSALTDDTITALWDHAATLAPTHAAASGGFSWAGVATSSRPPTSATASGSFSWAGTATASKVATAVAVGAFSWVGAATATAPQSLPHATTTGAFGWSGAATSTATHHATAAGTFGWTGVATSDSPALPGDATANPAARLTLDPTPGLTLTATPTLTLTMTRPEVTLDTNTATVADTAPLTGKAGTDLTGAGVEAHVKLGDGTPLTLTTTVTDAATGAWSAAWPAGGVPDETGVAEVELQVTYSDGTVQTLGPVVFSIRSQYA